MNNPSVDTHLQAKSMTVSADFVKPKPQREKVKKSFVVEKKKVGDFTVREKKKEVNIIVKDEFKDVKDLIEGLDIKRMTVPTNGGGGRRRSFSGSQIHAVDFARKTHDSLEKFTSKTLALTLKKEFDGVYGPAWHCIVGTSFGSFVTHSVGGFLYFSMDQKMYVLLFKTTVQRAE
ncbi:Dynein light chain type 1 family protein [Euphorbia peplus]|nr:Dynein light chain type 1 family protein [Euphorbia peplus]